MDKITQLIHYGHTPKENNCMHCGAKAGSYEAGKVCPNAEMIHISIMRKEINTLMTEFGGLKSGKKIQKKVSQMYKRDVKRLTKMEVDERLKAFNDIVRKKPKYFPRFLWNWIRNLVLTDTLSI